MLNCFASAKGAYYFGFRGDNNVDTAGEKAEKVAIDFNDITNRKKAEEELARAKDELE